MLGAEEPPVAEFPPMVLPPVAMLPPIAIGTPVPPLLEAPPPLPVAPPLPPFGPPIECEPLQEARGKTSTRASVKIAQDKSGRLATDMPTSLPLMSVLVEGRPRQDHLAAIDLRAELHLGAVVGRQRRQADRDGRGQWASAWGAAALATPWMVAFKLPGVGVR